MSPEENSAAGEIKYKKQIKCINDQWKVKYSIFPIILITPDGKNAAG